MLRRMMKFIIVYAACLGALPWGLADRLIRWLGLGIV